jgi:hypothetical protein
MQRSRDSFGLTWKPHRKILVETGRPDDVRFTPAPDGADSYVSSDGTFSEVMLFDPGQLLQFVIILTEGSGGRLTS